MVEKPVCIDLFCGLGGWSEGFLAEGYQCIGFDIEAHDYGDGGYPGKLVTSDVRTIHGSKFANATCIVASPPCTEYSYMAMPWSRAKQIARAIRGLDEFPEGYTGSRTIPQLNELFATCFRIQREAIHAAHGRFIPLVIENVRGAIPWVGQPAWKFGSFYLWGDVPALMPITLGRTVMKRGISHRANGETNFHGSAARAKQTEGVKVGMASERRWEDRPVKRLRGAIPVEQHGSGHIWYRTGNGALPSKSKRRKAASALIAKIPFPLAQHIARSFKP